MPIDKTAYDLRGMTYHSFACLFPIYDWQSDDGRENLGDWIEQAAATAGR
ncbi:hypothetical protein [Edaphobacter aggregans]|nr:hypothetical protein [Edaphobacter aggregans]